MFLEKEFKWNDDAVEKVFRNYWNAKKFLKWLEDFRDDHEGKNPTHLVFDSTVWFPWRTRITKKMDIILSWKMKSSWCVNCLTDCILATRWNATTNSSSSFCIYDWLDQTDIDKENIAFSWLSTVPYPEIRPIKDTIAYYMWTYIER